MLEQLESVQETFRSKYNKRAIEYVCGKGARECQAAFRGWTGALPKNFEQLIRDGTLNSYNGLTNLGYNSKKVRQDFEATDDQLSTYSIALAMAIGGSTAES